MHQKNKVINYIVKKKHNFLFCIGIWPINKQCCDSFRQTAKELSHTYRCIYSLLNPPPIPAATQHRAEFPVLYSRSLLVIHFKNSSVYMLIQAP